MDSIAITETKNILEREYNIFLDTKEIVNLKVTKLWEIEQNNKRSTPIFEFMLLLSSLLNPDHILQEFI